MFIDTTYRSSASEIMDDFAMEGEVLRDALDKIASINRLLGGNKVTLNGVRQLLRNDASSDVIRITDIGCGNGDMLRALAAFAEQKGLRFELKGIDANNFTISHARQLSTHYPNISYDCADILAGDYHYPPSDIVICTLTLHHFSDPEILRLISDFKAVAKLGIVINDLHRSAIAYYLFKGLCYTFGLNYMSREDGLVSILRGFKRKDLQEYGKKLKLKDTVIKWKWAFRYQWIIKL